MSQHPKVSVVVPVYNVEDYLDECLESLAAQTLDDIQIVLVDDGSTDTSREIAEGFVKRHPDRFELHCKPNGGQGSARNLAMKHCQGEYIGFTDADDYCAPDMFEKLYKAAMNARADKVLCGYWEFRDEHDGEFARKPTFPSRPHSLGGYFVAICVNSPIMLLRRRVVEESGVLFPEGIAYEDLAFHANMLAYVKKTVHVDEALYFRRWRAGSTMTTLSAERVADIFPCFDAIWAHYKDCNLLGTYGDQVEYLTVRTLLCSSLGRIGLVEGKDARKVLFDRTAKYIEEYCPGRQRNSLMKSGALSMYLRFASRPLYGCASKMFSKRYVKRKGFK